MPATTTDVVLAIAIEIWQGSQRRTKERLLSLVDYWADRVYLHHPGERLALDNRAIEYFVRVTAHAKAVSAQGGRR